MNIIPLNNRSGNVESVPPTIGRPKVVDAISRAAKRAKINLNNGLTLGQIAEEKSDILSLVEADLLKLSADKRANGEVKNLADKSGREFTYADALISASCRSDCNYARKTARRHRKRIYETFHEILPEVMDNGWFINFITLTFPNLLGVGFFDNDRFQTRAFALFLQRKIVSDTFHAGFSKTEWTTRKKDWSLEKHGVNFHLHLLTVSKILLANGNTHDLENSCKTLAHSSYTADERRDVKHTLRIISQWSECLRVAHYEVFGKPLRVKTKSKRVMADFVNVDIGEVTSFSLEESRKGVFYEIAKPSSYTAKGMNFNGLPPELMLEAQQVFRNKRVLNPFGAFRKKVEAGTDKDLDKRPTQQSEPTAILGVKLNSYQDLQTLEKTVDFDTNRGENEKLKHYGIRLCANGYRDLWLDYLKVNSGLIIQKKIDQLLERIPTATFTDLQGNVYKGWRAEKMLKDREFETESAKIWHQYQNWYFSQLNNGVSH